MLAIEVTLLTGRYAATAFDDRGRVEWPPHPARLFSALAATHFEAAEPSSSERVALQWLEQQGPPEIAASEAIGREVTTVFVPVNDTSVVDSLDKEVALLAEARGEVEGARAKGAKGDKGDKGAKALAAAEKKLTKAEARFAEAVRRATAPAAAGAKESKQGPADAASLLPERRRRQPRTFPSVAPTDPRVVFTWPGASPVPEMRATLDALAARVVRLGCSSSLVTVSVHEGGAEATWVPDATGDAPLGEEVLRVVGPGQMDALAEAHAHHADVPGRVMPASFQRYVQPSPASAPPSPASVFGEDWIILRRVEGPRLPSTRGVDVARTLRKALMVAYGPDAPEILSGHRPAGEPSEKPHLAFVPLPRVGDAHADGAILGVALVLPRKATHTERLAVYRAIGAWEARARREDEETPRLAIHMGKAGDLWVERVDGEESRSTLDPSTWSAEASSWASATPVALDRNPGDLRARDPGKEAAAYAEAEATVAVACERIGLPRPQVTVVPAAPLVGADKARSFPPYAAGTPPVQRVLVHATLTFASRVKGPILLGAGRYFGLGLFRP
ncbi:MAG: type I-U CRISPR-associated protein Csb2, partial [Minicystis sp.]